MIPKRVTIVLKYTGAEQLLIGVRIGLEDKLGLLLSLSRPSFATKATIQLQRSSLTVLKLRSACTYNMCSKYGNGYQTNFASACVGRQPNSFCGLCRSCNKHSINCFRWQGSREGFIPFGHLHCCRGSLARKEDVFHWSSLRLSQC